MEVAVASLTSHALQKCLLYLGRPPTRHAVLCSLPSLTFSLLVRDWDLYMALPAVTIASMLCLITPLLVVIVHSSIV
eukprot:12481171-Prorocentrum_lima.AAC.1